MGSQRRRSERLIIRYREIYKVHLLTGPDSPWAGFMINEKKENIFSGVCVCHSRAVCDMRSIKFGQ